MIAARDRDPAARGVSPAEILATWPASMPCSPTASRTRFRREVPFLPRLISMLTRAVTGIEIHPAARSGEAFHRSRRRRGHRRDRGNRQRRDALPGRHPRRPGFATGKRHPTVQDNVTIGSGAKLLGPITIGHGAQIGANSIIITDVPPNTTVVGNPGHPVRVDGRRVEGPDADSIHLPDPVAEAIHALSSRIVTLERLLSEHTDARAGEIAEVRPLAQSRARTRREARRAQTSEGSRDAGRARIYAGCSMPENPHAAHLQELLPGPERAPARGRHAW